MTEGGAAAKATLEALVVATGSEEIDLSVFRTAAA